MKNACKANVKFTCDTEDHYSCRHSDAIKPGDECSFECSFQKDGCDCDNRDAQMAALILFKGKMLK